MRLLTTILAISALFDLRAQITLEQVFEESQGATPRVMEGGELIYYAKTGSGADRELTFFTPDNVLLFTVDLSSMPVFLLPSGQPNYVYFIGYVQRNLFDLDDEIEFMFNTGNSSENYTAIIDQDGTVMAEFDGYVNGPAGVDSGNSVMNTADGTKLHVSVANSNPPPYTLTVHRYGLPGTLYVPCCSESTNGIAPQPDTTPAGLGLARPNPSTGKFSIPYQLPEGAKSGELVIMDSAGREIKTVLVGKTFNEVWVDLSNHPSSVYYCQLRLNGKPIEAKRLVVRK